MIWATVSSRSCFCWLYRASPSFAAENIINLILVLTIWWCPCVEESWELKNWCFWTVVLEKTLESPLDCKEIQPVHSKGAQCWVFIGRTDAEAETPILWPPGVKNWLIWKDPDAGKDFRQEEKGMTEHEMVGWCHRLDGHEFEQALGVGEGQGRLEYCSPWSHKESDTTEQLNWADWTGRRKSPFPDKDSANEKLRNLCMQ